MNGTTGTVELLGDAPLEGRGLSAEEARVEGQNPAGSSRGTARAVGVLVLGGYLTYGVGSAVATGIASAPDYLSRVASSIAFPAAAVLMLVNSALVMGIGALMFPILRRHSPAVAVGYLATRVFEGVVLAVGILSLLSLVTVSRGYTAGGADDSYFATLGSLASSGNFLAYNVAMAGLGVGSIFFCSAMYRSNLVPRFLAAWGVMGYAIFAAGCLLEILGVTGAGMVAMVPGGLFEVFFATWLIAKGFNRPAITPGAAPIAGTRSQ
jgi:Domain of unknown function (DUF4386)